MSHSSSSSSSSSRLFEHTVEAPDDIDEADVVAILNAAGKRGEEVNNSTVFAAVRQLAVRRNPLRYRTNDLSFLFALSPDCWLSCVAACNRQGDFFMAPRHTTIGPGRHARLDDVLLLRWVQDMDNYPLWWEGVPRAKRRALLDQLNALHEEVLVPFLFDDRQDAGRAAAVRAQARALVQPYVDRVVHTDGVRVTGCWENGIVCVLMQRTWTLVVLPAMDGATASFYGMLAQGEVMAHTDATTTKNALLMARGAGAMPHLIDDVRYQIRRQHADDVDEAKIEEILRDARRRGRQDAPAKHEFRQLAAMRLNSMYESVFGSGHNNSSAVRAAGFALADYGDIYPTYPDTLRRRAAARGQPFAGYRAELERIAKQAAEEFKSMPHFTRLLANEMATLATPLVTSEKIADRKHKRNKKNKKRKSKQQRQQANRASCSTSVLVEEEEEEEESEKVKDKEPQPQSSQSRLMVIAPLVGVIEYANNPGELQFVTVGQSNIEAVNEALLAPRDDWRPEDLGAAIALNRSVLNDAVDVAAVERLIAARGLELDEVLFDGALLASEHVTRVMPGVKECVVCQLAEPLFVRGWGAPFQCCGNRICAECRATVTKCVYNCK